jgi:hypothetical protein
VPCLIRSGRVVTAADPVVVAVAHAEAVVGQEAMAVAHAAVGVPAVGVAVPALELQVAEPVVVAHAAVVLAE